MTNSSPISLPFQVYLTRMVQQIPTYRSPNILVLSSYINWKQNTIWKQSLQNVFVLHVAIASKETKALTSTPNSKNGAEKKGL